MALYRATGEQAFLDAAVALADEYLANSGIMSPNDFSADGLSFWDGLVPKFPELLELYEATGKTRFLDAARAAARSYAQFIWMCPAIPDQDVLVNEGGHAPQYWYLNSKGHPPMAAAMERVPAWQLSEIGLCSEGPGTCAGHRGVLLAMHAPTMLRLSHLTNDKFLHDIARSAIVGRYANFPGYHINTARTTVYEKADYPLRDHTGLSYNSFHYNHIWPHAALVLDYLVSDVYARSAGQIDFPAHFAEGYAYLKGKVYGDRPGRFYQDDDVWLWMPRHLLTLDNLQLNYVAAIRNQKLYLALANQSPEKVDATLRINRELVEPTAAQLVVKEWRNNHPLPERRVTSFDLSVSVPAQGLTALAIESVKPQVTRSRQSPIGDAEDRLNETAMVDLDFADGTRGMLISTRPDERSAYVYLQATVQTVTEARLHYRLGDTWRIVTDQNYPYEFTVDVPQDVPRLKFYLETVDGHGNVSKSKQIQLGSAQPKSASRRSRRCVGNSCFLFPSQSPLTSRHAREAPSVTNSCSQRRDSRLRIALQVRCDAQRQLARSRRFSAR